MTMTILIVGGKQKIAGTLSGYLAGKRVNLSSYGLLFMARLKNSMSYVKIKLDKGV